MMEIIHSLLPMSLIIQTKYSQRYVSSITHYMIYDDKENWLSLWQILRPEFPLRPFNYPLCLSLLGFVRNPSRYPLLNAIRKIQKRRLSPAIVRATRLIPVTRRVRSSRVISILKKKYSLSSFITHLKLFFEKITTAIKAFVNQLLFFDNAEKSRNIHYILLKT